MIKNNIWVLTSICKYEKMTLMTKSGYCMEMCDKCKCGGYPFKLYEHHKDEPYSIVCTVCAESTEKRERLWEAMTEWNKKMRAKE